METNLPPTAEMSDLGKMTVLLFKITGKRNLLLSYFLFSYGSSFAEFRVLKPPGYNLFIRRIQGVQKEIHCN